MATTPKPRILPKIVYAPPSDPPVEQNTLGAQASAQMGTNYADLVELGLVKPAGWEDTNTTRPADRLSVGGGQGAPLPPQGNPWNPYQTYGLNPNAMASDPRDMGQSPAQPNTPTPNYGGSSGPRDSSGWRPANTGGVPQSALTNNRNNLAAAQAAGDTANIARLEAEWKRIAPLAQQWNISPDRLVNSYMQPTNPAAKSDLTGALSAAIADDVWGNEATKAFGRPPNQQEWDEHWRAMNVGGRDPLEGHPQSVQNIQAQMQQIQNGNQTSQFTDYQNWLAGK